MKVHITATSDVAPELVIKVIDLLIVVKGVISFDKVDSYDNDLIGSYIGDFEKMQPISPEKMFEVCTYIRRNRNISDDDFFVLFTSLRFTHSIFSATDQNKQIIININDWESITEGLVEFAISYQVVGNIFHYLIGLTYNTQFANRWHEKAIGCISDYCNEKSDIILKFRTGYICANCLKHVTENGYRKEAIHIHYIIQELRKEFVNVQLFRTKEYYLPISVDNRLDIYIGERKIVLNPLERTLYLFFLTNQNGITTIDLYDDSVKDKLKKIYSQVKGREIEGPIINLCTPGGTTFQPLKAAVNTSVISAVGGYIGENYTIKTIDNNSVDIFKVNIPTDYILINEYAKTRLTLQ